MNELETLHRNAMAVAQDAAVEAAAGNVGRARELFAIAFDHERRAAEMLILSVDVEPTRSVLLRSAASLALDCGEFRSAEQLIAHGLAGKPPAEIAEDLRDLLEQVHFQRHLDVKGVQLEPTGFQMSLMGEAVGFGIVSSESFLPRVQDLERMMTRTAHRRAGRPFRDRLNRGSRLSREVGVYLSVPRAASFAVTVHIGYGLQLNLPGVEITRSAGVIEDALDCLEALQEGNIRELQRRIPDVAYRRNFLALAKRIAPDGQAISAVGFTVSRLGGGERRILLTKTQASIPSAGGLFPEDRSKGEAIKIEGILRYADSKFASKTNVVGVIDKAGRTHKVLVPEGMMDDIVRPLWDYKVTVVGLKRKGQSIVLRSIFKLEDDAEEPPPF